MLRVGLSALGGRPAAAVAAGGALLAVRGGSRWPSRAAADALALAKAALASPGVDPSLRVTTVAVVSSEGRADEPVSRYRLTQVRAVFPGAHVECAPASACLARLAATSVEGDTFVLVARGLAPWNLFSVADGETRHLGCVDGSDVLARSVRKVAALLGLVTADWLQEFSELADEAGEPGAHAAGPSMYSVAGAAIVVNEGAVEGLLAGVRVDRLEDLSEPAHPHRAVQQARRTVANAVIGQLCEAVSAVAAQAAARVGIGHVALAGEWFDVPGLNSRLRHVLRDLHIAPMSGAEALAAGAALGASRPSGPISHLALGAFADDGVIKQTLDNCRIDYVYEPRMERLFQRTGALLANGKQVGWFQGPAEVGPRALGGRSVLADAGNRHARENLNVFLFRRSLGRALMLSIQQERCGDIIEEPACPSRFGEWQGRVREERREAVGAALDPWGRCAFHTVTDDAPSFLWHLLEVCRTSHGITGLLNVPLLCDEQRRAATPREAIQAFYSSAVDALVLGRFLLMKDYWLLRSDLG